MRRYSIQAKLHNHLMTRLGMHVSVVSMASAAGSQKHLVRLLIRWAVTWARLRQQQNKQLIKLESKFGAKVVTIDCVHPGMT